MKQVVQPLAEQAVVSSVELDIRTASGETRTVLLFAQLLHLDGMPCIFA